MLMMRLGSVTLSSHPKDGKSFSTLKGRLLHARMPRVSTVILLKPMFNSELVQGYNRGRESMTLANSPSSNYATLLLALKLVSALLLC